MFQPMKKMAIEEKTVTTNTSNGNASLGKTISDGVVVAAWIKNDSSYFCTPLLLSGNQWWLHFETITSAHSTPASGTSFTVCYILEKVV